jgi:hypothetical protein
MADNGTDARIHMLKCGGICLHALLSQSRNAYRWGKLLGGLLARCVKSQQLWVS